MSSKTQFTRSSLYSQSVKFILDQIVLGRWLPGDVLPSEPELAEQLGVSQGTVRRALDQLEGSGVLDRRQGRGTFVVDQASEQSVMRFNRLRDELGRPIRREVEMLKQDRGLANAIEQERLQIGPGEQVIRTTRVRKRHGRAFVYEQASLALASFPGLTTVDPGDYSISALAQKHGTLLSRALERIDLDPATAEVARALSIAAGTCLQRLDRVVYSTADLPVEWRTAHCNLKGEYFSAAYS